MGKGDIPPKTSVKKVVDWLTFFEKIRHRPALWMGSTSITRLQMFILGMRFAEEVYEIPKEWLLDGFPFEEFEKWVDSPFNSERLSSNSLWLAAQLTDSEEAGFTRWFSWYDQFRRERGID